MFLCFIEIPSLGKQKPCSKPTKESMYFFSETETHGAYAEVAVLARIPLRLTKAGEIAPAPELHFESSRKWEKIHGLAVGLKHHLIQLLGWCGSAGSLAAGLGAHVQQLRSSWEMCDTQPWHWGSRQLKSSVLPAASAWAPNPPPVLGVCTVLEASLKQLWMVSLLLSGDICVAGSSYNNSVNMNEHVSLIMSS